ncbi:MAG: hypothetical protein FJZ04_00125 [Candidatus Moranbacteria bacterium]|nr:hypothetical protein [Candidatus Moranbacteria bacterium]
MFSNLGFTYLATLVILIGVAIFLPGCYLTDKMWEKIGEGTIEKTIESQTGGAVNLDLQNKSLNVKTQEGTMNIAGEGNAALPENFPSDVFIYNDAKIVFSLAQAPGMGGTEGYSISYNTGAAQNDAIAKYKSEMASRGWELDNEVNMGAESGDVLSFKKGVRQVTVSIGTSEGKTAILVASGNADQIPGQAPIQQ